MIKDTKFKTSTCKEVPFYVLINTVVLMHERYDKMLCAICEGSMKFENILCVFESGYELIHLSRSCIEKWAPNAKEKLAGFIYAIGNCDPTIGLVYFEKDHIYAVQLNDFIASNNEFLRIYKPVIPYRFKDLKIEYILNANLYNFYTRVPVEYCHAVLTYIGRFCNMECQYCKSKINSSFFIFMTRDGQDVLHYNKECVKKRLDCEEESVLKTPLRAIVYRHDFDTHGNDGFIIKTGSDTKYVRDILGVLNME